MGVIKDNEFNRYDELLVIECDATEAFTRWKTEHQFKTRWNLGLGE